MDKSMIIGSLMGATVVTAGGAGALAMKQNGTLNMPSLGLSGPTYAEVVQVEPVQETVRKPRQECHNEVVTYQQPPKDQHKVTGTVIGAVIGGVVGNQIGGGNGKKLATVAGAAAGGYAGNQVQGQMQANNTYQVTEQRCETKYDVSQKTIGYDVTYKFKDKQETIRMDQKPGDRLQVDAEGKIVLDKDAKPEA